MIAKALFITMLAGTVFCLDAAIGAEDGEKDGMTATIKSIE